MMAFHMEVILLSLLISCDKYTCKNHIHQKIASDCLENIMRNNFLVPGRGGSNNVLLTVLVYNNIRSPSYGIQHNIIGRIHDEYQMEIVSPRNENELQSNDDCEYRSDQQIVENYKTSFYLIILDDEHIFGNLLKILKRLKTFNPNAYYLIYFENQEENPEMIAENILEKMWNNLISFSGVLVTEKLQTFGFYQLSSKNRRTSICGSQVEINMMGKCQKGTMLNIKKQYFRTSIMENCTVNVIARPYIPFVINDSYGFEIEILRSIGHMSNINFNITISNDMVDSWGCKINDSWTGNLNLVYDEMYLGIGNIDIGMGNSTDFDFSQFYHIEPLIYVVPAAELVPKWRILTVIFTIEMWGICIVTMIIFSLTFCCSSLFFKKQAETTRMQSPFLSSFQVLIGQVVDQQPVQDVQRVFFISLSIFSIIISSLYTSSLIYYLKNPIKQHQISDPEELFDIFGNIQYEVGGLLKYRMFYNLTNSPKLLKLLDVYQSISEGNETVEYWLQMVSIRNDFWTISSDFFVKYLLAIGSNSTTNPDGQPKVTPLNKPLLSYPVGIIMRRGHPLLERINSSIKQLLYGGFVSHFCRQYLNKIGEDNIIDNLKNTAIFQALSLEHLQGAFAVLTSGYITGGVTLITECIFDILMSKRNWPN